MSRNFLYGCAILIISATFWELRVATTRAEEGQPLTTRHYLAKELIGSAVNIEDKASVGIIDDIVLTEGGEVEYLIVVTPDKRLITVPWVAAVLDTQKRTAVISITPDRFRKIPTYSRGDYPEFSAPTYRTQIDQYYGVSAERRRIIKRGNPAIVK